MSSERQSFITYLLRPRETEYFVNPRPPNNGGLGAPKHTALPRSQ
jgi:hypothetical protein